MEEKQADALRLADWLEADACDLQPPMDAAAELRRLHAENERLKAERDELLALLHRIRAWDMMDVAADGPCWKREIDAAIAKVEGRTCA